MRRRLSAVAGKVKLLRLSAWLDPGPRLRLYDGDWNVVADTDRGDHILATLDSHGRARLRPYPY